MDAIALCEAGFPQTVAPLGTALTEEQVGLLWRMAPEPVLCFDGDAAGRRAAFRAVETVLPHLKPGFSVQFAFLPDGLDPDDLIRQHGPAAFQEILDGKLSPLFDVLIEREERQGQPAVTPEQRASLEARLQALVARIARPRRAHALRARAARDVVGEKPQAGSRDRGRRWTALGPLRRQAAQQHDTRLAGVGPGQRSARGWGPPPRAGNATPLPPRSNELAEHAALLPAREALLICTLINHPWLLEARCEEVAQLTLTASPLAVLRDALLELLAEHNALDRGELRTQLTRLGLDKVVAMVERAITHRGDKFVAWDAEPSDVEAGWQHTVTLHETQVGLKRALAAAERDWQTEPTEAAWSRIAEIQQRLAGGIDIEGASRG